MVFMNFKAGACFLFESRIHHAYQLLSFVEFRLHVRIGDLSTPLHSARDDGQGCFAVLEITRLEITRRLRSVWAARANKSRLSNNGGEVESLAVGTG